MQIKQQGNAQGGDLLPKRLPLVIEPSNRDDTTDKDARLVNCYMETKAGREGNEYWIYKRPGILDSGTGQAASTGRGVYNWRGNIYSIFGATLYKDGVNKGTVDTTNGVYKFSSCMGVTPKLQLGNGVKAYNYDDAGGLVQIVDADFPAAFVKGWAFLDGTTYVMTADASIQGDDINDPVNWDPLNQLTAEIEPDGGVALGKQLVNAIAMKQWTTEVFYDAGNATGSPLGRVAGSKADVGCVSADSVQDCDGTLVWVTQARNASASVVAMVGLKVSTISSKGVERLLEGADFGVVYSWYIKVDSHRFYVVTLKNQNLTLACDLNEVIGTERAWHQWTDVNGKYFPIVASTFDSSMRRVVQHESNGKLYYVDPDFTNDAGSIIVSDIYTPNFDGGTRRRNKLMNILEPICDQQVGSELLVRSSDDDYKSWTNFRSLDLSQPRPMLTDCGTFRRRAHNFRHQSDTRFRMQAVEMQLDLGTL